MNMLKTRDTNLSLNHAIGGLLVAALLGITLVLPTNVKAQSCSFPNYNVVFPNNTTGLTWSTSPFVSRISQVASSPDVYMRATWVGRSSSSVGLNDFDATTPYGFAWQPFLSVPSTTSTTDTSWAEFIVEFSSVSNFSSLLTLNCLAITVVDCDGSGTTSSNNSHYREMVQVINPNAINLLSGSNVTIGTVDSFETIVSDFPVFNNIDTINKAAMAQIEYGSVDKARLRIAVIGKRGSTTTRQFSLHFRPYSVLTSILPVTLADVKAEVNAHGIELQWKTLYEQMCNRFVVYKYNKQIETWDSVGVNYCNEVSFSNINYIYQDYNPELGDNFYKLKQVDRNGEYTWSDIVSTYWGSLQNLNYTMFPNPVDDKMYIKGPSIHLIEVYDNLGRVVSGIEYSHYDRSISTAQLLPGSYLLVMENGRGMTQKLMFLKQ